MTEATGTASTPALGMERPLARNETQNPQPKYSKTEVSTDLTARRVRSALIEAYYEGWERGDCKEEYDAQEAIKWAEREVSRLFPVPSPTAQGAAVAWRFRSMHGAAWSYVPYDPKDLIHTEAEPLYATPQADVTGLTAALQKIDETTQKNVAAQGLNGVLMLLVEIQQIAEEALASQRNGAGG